MCEDTGKDDDDIAAHFLALESPEGWHTFADHASCCGEPTHELQIQTLKCACVPLFINKL